MEKYLDLKVRKYEISAVTDCKIRMIEESEYRLLEEFLYEAIFVPEGMPLPFVTIDL